MPRQARLDVPGILQHVIVRGIERRKIFADDRDRRAFVERLGRLLDATGTRCLAWALIPNHFHLLLQPAETPLATFMRRLLTGHAVTFNLRHRRTGHLFQNRYKSIVCEEEEYLLALVRYIHLNPLRAQLVSGLDELDGYPWCGHAVIMGRAALPGQAVGEVLGRFGEDVEAARRGYRAFVGAGVSLGRQEALTGGGLRRSIRNHDLGRKEGRQAFDERVLGGGEFVEALWRREELRGRLGPRLSVAGVVQRVAGAYGTTPEAICRRRNIAPLAEARAVACCLAVVDLGYTGVEVGLALHLGRAGVSAAVRRGIEALKSRPLLRSVLLGEE